MTEPVSTEARLRAMMLGISGLIALGTLGELALAEHTGSTVQWLPFAFCGLALGAAGMVLRAPTRRTLLVARGVWVVLALGSAFGTWEHLEHNYAFEAEIRPSASVSEVAIEAVFGANPLLAPGIFAGIALLGLGATWRHPSLLASHTP